MLCLFVISQQHIVKHQTKKLKTKVLSVLFLAVEAAVMLVLKEFVCFTNLMYMNWNVSLGC